MTNQNQGEHVGTGGFRVNLNGATRHESETQEIIRRNKIISHFESHLRNPLLDKAISGQSTFQKETLDFYGFYPWVHPGNDVYLPSTTYLSKEEDASKKGLYPKDLVNIIDFFGDKPLDTQRLLYNNVRQEYLAQKGYADKWRTMGMSTMLLSFIPVIYDTLNGFQVIGICTGLSSILLGGASAILSANKLTNAEKLNFGEFAKLYSKAEKADRFMGQHRDAIKRWDMYSDQHIMGSS